MYKCFRFAKSHSPLIMSVFITMLSDIGGDRDRDRQIENEIEIEKDRQIETVRERDRD